VPAPAIQNTVIKNSQYSSIKYLYGQRLGLKKALTMPGQNWLIFIENENKNFAILQNSFAVLQIYHMDGLIVETLKIYFYDSFLDSKLDKVRLCMHVKLFTYISLMGNDCFHADIQ